MTRNIKDITGFGNNIVIAGLDPAIQPVFKDITTKQVYQVRYAGLGPQRAMTP